MYQYYVKIALLFCDEFDSQPFSKELEKNSFFFCLQFEIILMQKQFLMLIKNYNFFYLIFSGTLFLKSHKKYEN